MYKLRNAVNQHNIEQIQLLLSLRNQDNSRTYDINKRYGGAQGSTVIEDAIGNVDKDVIKVLLGYGADISGIDIGSLGIHTGPMLMEHLEFIDKAPTELHLAIKYGCNKLAAELILEGADVNSIMTDGTTSFDLFNSFHETQGEAAQALGELLQAEDLVQ